MAPPNAPPAGPLSPRLIFGIGVMAVGAILLLDDLGLAESRHWLQFWPVILLLAGFSKLAQPRGCRHGAFPLVAIGAVLLAVNTGQLSLRQVVPVVLLFLGARMVWKAVRPVTAAPAALVLRSAGPPGLQAFAFMGGLSRRPDSLDAASGSATAIMGGCEIDLTGADPVGGAFTIDTFAFWGGIEITVPEDWEVVNQGLPLLGGFEDKTVLPEHPRARLVVTGVALMGGVGIKNPGRH
jgi:hypothetical protein